MKLTSIIAAIVLAGSMLTTAALAQTGTPIIGERQRNQQARIRHGVKNGELTGKETRRLERGEAKIQADKLNAKADGKVTPHERRKLNRDLNRQSRKIHRMKHNDKVRG